MMDVLLFCLKNSGTTVCGSYFNKFIYSYVQNKRSNAWVLETLNPEHYLPSYPTYILPIACISNALLQRL